MPLVPEAMSAMSTFLSWAAQRPIRDTICGGVPTATSGGRFSTRILSTEYVTGRCLPAGAKALCASRAALQLTAASFGSLHRAGFLRKAPQLCSY